MPRTCVLLDDPSSPCDLKESAERLARPANLLYMKDFLRYLRHKIRSKMPHFPDQLHDREFHLIKSFKEYDDRYTAPLHGFRDAEDYWLKCSCKQFLHSVRVPSVIINAIDDPFLGPSCFPIHEAEQSAYITLEMPRHGGHLGFVAFNRVGFYWSEARAIALLEQLTPNSANYFSQNNKSPHCAQAQ